MFAESRPQTPAQTIAITAAATDGMEITLDSNGLPVSYLSSLLRVIQAALREVARNGESTRQAFSQQAQPTLLLSASTLNCRLALQFTFADPVDSSPLGDVSKRVFDAFMTQFSAFLKGLPQRGLWGESAGGSHRQRFDSQTARRMEQLRVELRRFPNICLKAGRRSILIEGDRMEIE
jgi:hypothetical protein